MNPLELDIILERIVAHTDHKTTLTCRLVNHRWNNKALGALEQEGAVLALHSGNIAEYLDLVSSSGQNEPCLPLRIQFGRQGDDQVKGQELLGKVYQLLQQFNSEELIKYIDTLSCTSYYHADLDWAHMSPLFRRIGPGLRQLDIREGVFNNYIGFLNLEPGTEFPQLHTLSYAAILKNAALLFQIVLLAPRLAKLEIIVEPLENHNPNAFAFCSQNLAGVFNTIANSTPGATLPNLIDLATVLDAVDTYKALQRLQFPGLQRLHLTLNSNPDQESSRILARFLALNCPNLRWLEFVFVQNIGRAVTFPMDPLISEIPARLPPLPRLEHFGYGVNRMFSPSNGPPMIRMDNLAVGWPGPAVRSASVKFGAFLYASAPFVAAQGPAPAPAPQQPQQPPALPALHFYGNPHLIGGVVFPSVKKLHLLLEDFDGLSMVDHQLELGYPEVTRRYVCNQLHMLYPNVRHLRMDLRLKPEPTMFSILHRVAPLLLEEIVGLEELEIRGPSPSINFLPRILTREHADAHPQLKRLTLPRVGQEFRDAVNRKTQRRCPSTQGIPLIQEEPNLGLERVLGLFRSLERVLVPEEFVRRENVGQLQARYPNVKIKVI